MEEKIISFKTKGMQKDLSASAFTPDYSYENKNMRITSTDESTLLSLVNEKGNKHAVISGIGDSIQGIPIGQAIIDNNLILFTTNSSTSKDYIYKMWLDGDTVVGTTLYDSTNGSLRFDATHPIETTIFYENEDIQKVYWTDGLNPPRMINVVANDIARSKWNKNSFDFVRTLKLREEVTIDKNIVAGGSFSPGTIQYMFTYFDKYGQESNIFYTSPLYYISYNNRGASPEDKVSNSFNIAITNIDTTNGDSSDTLATFDYVRIYSIHRTSIDATPVASIVVDVAPKRNIVYNTDGSINRVFYDIHYTDTGLNSSTIDPTELLYVGGEDVTFSTMEHKDNTLFLGDFILKRKLISPTIKNYFKGKTINFKNFEYGNPIKAIDSPTPKGYYPYTNQLSLNSEQFKTFKYLEYYRFGVQFQHFTGKWSEPIWINDARNTLHIDTTFWGDGGISLPIAEFNLTDATTISNLITAGYIKVRPVIVYPSINDRESVCQGVLCPTVYNVADRYSNSPFAQSSWFTRPNAPFDIYKAFHDVVNPNSGLTGDWFALGYGLGDPTIYSRAAISYNDRINLTYNSSSQYLIDVVNKGAWAEFRHNYPIPGNNQRNAEIQCIWNPPANPYIPDIDTDSDVTSWVSSNSENYYIDQSILTFHSPDIEFDNSIRSLDSSNLKLRIVGIVPLSAFASDIDIQTSTPVNNFKGTSDLPMGFYKEPIGVENDFSNELLSYKFGNSHYGWRGLISGAFWIDEATGYKVDTNTNKYSTGFAVYPWHRNGSLNNTKYATDGYRSAMLDKKKLSNLRYSYKSVYLDYGNIWNAYVLGDTDKTGISGVSIFDSNEVSLISIPAQKNSGLQDINYYGNIDKVITVPRIGAKKDGYPIMITGMQTVTDDPHTLFSRTHSSTESYVQLLTDVSDQNTGLDPISMKYKSTAHAVLALNYTSDGKQRILPTINDSDPTSSWAINAINPTGIDGQHMFWDRHGKSKLISQDIITTGLPSGPISGVGSFQHGWLWLAELYNDNVINRFGGQTEEAFENNQWLPCGEPILMTNANGTVKNSIDIKWTEGDTYYQRYDHIKTYPFTLEDQNAVTDIISFMCETRVNLDGRYDRNRGKTSNFAITPSNFNQMNPVYSQSNNFFNYRGINSNRLNLDNFHNSITWTKTKTSGELVDTWTNITLASTLDLDGDKGTIRSLKRLNNNLLAFQDKGISQILYNDNVQISSTAGVPIEIANSGKVIGKRYLSNTVGCVNKWSICETPSGLYFIDDINKDICLFNGQIISISDKLGFHSWINSRSDGLNIWDPKNFKGFITYYDKVNGDLFFVSKDECLAFSEFLNQFSSFYSYEATPYMANIGDKLLAVRQATNDSTGNYKVWIQHEGDYNYFYNVYQPFSTTIIANPDVQQDKIFTTVEFRANNVDSNKLSTENTFDKLDVWNEYQTGSSVLTNLKDSPSTLKKKFRIWRAIIPRDSIHKRDRMRNPWLYLKLSKTSENTEQTTLHDIAIHFFE